MNKAFRLDKKVRMNNEPDFLFKKIGSYYFQIHLTGMMMILVWLGVIFSFVCLSDCQSSTLVINVVEIKSGNNSTFVCSVSSAANLTRWNYLSGSTGSSLMSFQNGICSVSPPGSFLNTDKYSFACNTTVYQITIHNVQGNNIILACRDALRPDDEGFTWIIKSKQDGSACTYCEPTITFNVLEVIEGDKLTFACKVPPDKTLVNWNRITRSSSGSKTTAMTVQDNECKTSPSPSFLENATEYNNTCNSTIYQVTKLNVQRNEHNDMYMCTPANYTEGTGSNWIIKVKAPVTSVTLTPAGYLVDVKENAVAVFECTTSTARPDASVYWYMHPHANSNNITQITENITTSTNYNDLSVTTSVLRFVPTRHLNDTKIFCTAFNSVNTSHVISANKRLLNVQYKADDLYITQGNTYHVIEHTFGTLSCGVKGGNPTPTLSWSCNNFSQSKPSTIHKGGNSTTTLTWTVLRNHEGNCSCTSQQTGFPNGTKQISIVVLYPPSKPELNLNGDTVVGDILFMEATTRNITCTADSKPLPLTYTWTGPAIAGSINIQTLIFNNVKRNESGQYTCSVNNKMNPSSGDSVVGNHSTNVNVTILYPPVVNPMDNVLELNGTQLNLSCDYYAGQPKNTSIKWTRDVDHTEWNSVILHISSLKKNDAGVYTCTATNTMIPSGDNQFYIGQHNQSFYLDVLYKASVKSFTINGDDHHTVDENDTVRFICDVESNPTAMMTLSFGRNTLVHVKSNRVEYNITKADCLDAGTYHCSANNEHNKHDQTSKEVQFFVNCYPRATGEIDTNVTSENNESITMVFNFVAYPQPNLTWYQLVDGNWTALHDDYKYDINSSNIQSNLTVHNVASDDFTSYKVAVENDVGRMELFFFLSQYDVPDPPTEFRHIEGYSTSSSIHLEWKPGFDNGPPQTFYIKYRKDSHTNWNYVIVSDDGEQSMKLTLTELTEDTQYYIVIFASNEKGNSSESKVIVARTQAIDKPPPQGALIGGIAGGVTGCIVLVIVIIVIIRRYPLFKGKGVNELEMRRSVSDDSDEDDGLVDNPMYVSSNNVASAVPSSSGVTTTLPKPKQANASRNEDLYSVVNKTKKEDKVQKGKASTAKKSKDVDVYENVELANKAAKNDGAKELSPKTAPTSVPKLKIVNKDGLIYADLVFNDKPPGEKMVINGDDTTPYALVDFTKKAEPLPESDNEDEK